MKSIISSVALILCLVGLSDASEQYDIDGYVVDASGNPISGVMITMHGGDGLYTYSDTSGSWTAVDTNDVWTVTDSSGYWVMANNTGRFDYTITPSKENYSFSPVNYSYDDLSRDYHNQDFITGGKSEDRSERNDIGRESTVSEAPVLGQNVPNPFNPITTISYTLPLPACVTIDVMNIAGQRVRTLVNRSEGAGIYQVTWDGTNERGESVSSGVYFYRAVIDRDVQIKKMNLIR